MANRRPLTPKQERFAQLFATGVSGMDSAAGAGYSERSAHVTSSRLLKNAKVVARITTIREKQGTRFRLTQEWVVEQLVANAAAAVRAGQYGPANRAIELLGKQINMFRDTIDLNVIRTEAIEQGRSLGLAPDEVEAVIAEAERLTRRRP